MSQVVISQAKSSLWTSFLLWLRSTPDFAQALVQCWAPVFEIGCFPRHQSLLMQSGVAPV